MIDLLEDEKILLQKRRHWYALAAESTGLVVAALIPFALIVIAILAEPFKELLSSYWELVIFITSAWLLMTWMIFFIIWTNYYLDVLIVTNYRVIDIEQRGLFSRDLAEIHLSRIQDIKVEVVGLLASLMSFGDIYIQSAGESREIVVRNIAEPYDIKEIITKQYMQMINKK